MQHWDYASNAMYFVTICTENRICCFGNILNNKMEYSGIGIIADILWHEITNHAKNIELGEFIVMPNHIHGILIINENQNDQHTQNIQDTQNVHDAPIVETTHALSHPHDEETTHALSLQASQPNIGQNRYQHQGKNTLSSIVGAYKSAVSKHAHRLGYDFEWQSRFHDHIIRNKETYQKISNYILNNPSKWKDDKFYYDAI